VFHRGQKPASLVGLKGPHIPEAVTKITPRKPSKDAQSSDMCAAGSTIMVLTHTLFSVKTKPYNE